MIAVDPATSGLTERFPNPDKAVLLIGVNDGERVYDGEARAVALIGTLCAVLVPKRRGDSRSRFRQWRSNPRERD
jgi:hypothetical protein